MKFLALITSVLFTSTCLAQNVDFDTTSYRYLIGSDYTSFVDLENETFITAHNDTFRLGFGGMIGTDPWETEIKPEKDYGIRIVFNETDHLVLISKAYRDQQQHLIKREVVAQLLIHNSRKHDYVLAAQQCIRHGQTNTGVFVLAQNSSSDKLTEIIHAWKVDFDNGGQIKEISTDGIHCSSMFSS